MQTNNTDKSNNNTNKSNKYDCSKTLDYVHELNRLCGGYGANSCGFCNIDTHDYCPLYNFRCSDADSITERMIEILQKWSDKHPESDAKSDSHSKPNVIYIKEIKKHVPNFDDLFEYEE